MASPFTNANKQEEKEKTEDKEKSKLSVEGLHDIIKGAFKELKNLIKNGFAYEGEEKAIGNLKPDPTPAKGADAKQISK
jgi:hypothetical protein